MDQQNIGYLLTGILLLIWLYKSTVKVSENQVKVIENITGRYQHATSGCKNEQIATRSDVNNGKAKEIGELIPGKDSGSFDFILWPYQHVSTYKLHKLVTKESANLTDEEKKSPAWGNPEHDIRITLAQVSVSDHYRKQYTYEMVFDGLSTGKTQSAKGGPAQNVMMSIKLNVTVCLINVFQARYQEGDGGKWLTTMHGVIMSALSEIIARNSFDDMSDLRAKNFNEIVLDDGKTFLQRIKEQMIDIKKIGYTALDLDFIDDRVMEESKEFIKEKEKAALASLAKVTAADEAEAERLKLKPKLEAAKSILEENQKNNLELKKTADATSQQKFNALKDSQIRMYVEGSQPGSGGTSPVDVGQLIQGVTNLSIAREIEPELNGDGKNKSKDNNKK